MIEIKKENPGSFIVWSEHNEKNWEKMRNDNQK